MENPNGSRQTAAKKLQQNADSDGSMVAGGDLPRPATLPPVDIRESMRQLPAWMQVGLTELTGKAFSGQKPPRWMTRRFRIAFTIVELLTGIVLAAMLTQFWPGCWPLLPLVWVTIIHAARNVQTQIIHHASHKALTRKAKYDLMITEPLGALLWLPPLPVYAKAHGPHHFKTATDVDDDFVLLAALGFVPGMSIVALWRRLWLSLISPMFHGRMLWARLRANIILASRRRKLGFAALWAGLLAAATLGMATGLYSGWTILLLSLWAPLFLMNISALLQLLTEHTWARYGDGVDPAREVIARLTHGRFYGFAMPDLRGMGRLGRVVALSLWAIKMLGALAQRLLVCQGDLSQHDAHHRHPRGRVIVGGVVLDWANAAYARQADIDAGTPGWPAYTEHWNLPAQIAATFEAIANLPKRLGQTKPAGTHIDDEMMGM